MKLKNNPNQFNKTTVGSNKNYLIWNLINFNFFLNKV